MPCKLTKCIQYEYKPKKGKWRLYQYELHRTDRLCGTSILYYEVILINTKCKLGSKAKITMNEEVYINYPYLTDKLHSGLLTTKEVLKLLSL
jgi:hypothetical protein